MAVSCVAQEQTSEVAALDVAIAWASVVRLDTGCAGLSVWSCGAEVAAMVKVGTGTAGCGCWGRTVVAAGIWRVMYDTEGGREGAAAGVSTTHCSIILRPVVDWLGVAVDPGRSVGVEEEVLTCNRAPLTLNLALTSEGG